MDTGLRRHDGGSTEESIIRAPGITSLSLTPDLAAQAASGAMASIDPEHAEMARKKERAFFICPRWNEVAQASRAGATPAPIRVHEKTLAAIEAGRPVARSTLRRALLAARQASGEIFDLDAYIVDQRSADPR
ncbi:MAG TPA: hypothetical protein VFE41_29175 [Acetobacteraceae bacterium]|nr:hypothetical protein [Acetobacteraceae bacterium]